MTRLLTLLLITSAAAEWVEISQQHYRKPIRTHSVFTTPDKDLAVEDNTKPWTYNNRSVTEYNWNKTPARPPNIGNIKRVQHVGSTLKTTDRVPLEDDDLDLHIDFRYHELRPSYGPTGATVELHDKQKGMIERVPYVGNIKRVQLNDSPVKSPAVSFKGERDKYSNDRHETHEIDHDTDANDFEHKNTEVFRRIYVNKIKHHSTERPATIPTDDDEDTSSTEDATSLTTEKSKAILKNHTTVRDVYSTKPTFITETDNFTTYETQQKRFYKITNSKSSEITDKMDMFTTEMIETEEPTTKIIPKHGKPAPVKNNKENVHKSVNVFNAESHENKIHASRNDGIQPNPETNDHKTIPKGDKNKPKLGQVLNKNNDKETKGTKGEAPTATAAETEKNKVNTMENVIKFMRVVADTISKNSRRSFGGKIQYLHELKESILANIEERIDATWPDDESTSARRRSRSAHASPRGHVQFPSSESALMTISFLTFAVFLIKLVLQVIQTYKHKAMMVAPLMVASGRNVFTHQGHH